jgi:hypothetical protein
MIYSPIALELDFIIPQRHLVLMPSLSVSTECEALSNQRLMAVHGAWRRAVPGVGLAILLLLWPALLNGYPLVFSDTGTYLLQMPERHLGWDRPVFYSLLMVPLHAMLTTWPVVIAQAALTVYLLHLALRIFAGSAQCLMAIVGVLAVATGLPWVTAELIPDFSTALLAIVMCVLVIAPERLGRREHLGLAAVAAGLVSVHQANLPLGLLLLVPLLVLRRPLGAAAALDGRGLVLAAGPLLAATFALSAVNLIGHGRFSPAPYGNIFVLARSLADGPAMATLRRHCPQAGWRLCVLVQEGQPADADLFLWRGDSALYQVGGAVREAPEAGAIMRATLMEQPAAMLRTAVINFARQLGMVATGDGLMAWPDTVTPVIHRDFPPAEARRYDAALQTQGRLFVPAWLRDLHAVALLVGVVATLVALPVAMRRRHCVAALCVATLICLLGNAAITGALSGPHDRYQSRIAWLPVFVPMVAGLALRRGAPARLLNPLHDRASADVAGPTAWS